MKKKLKGTRILIPGKIPSTTFQNKGVNRKTGKLYSKPEAIEARQHFRGWIAKTIRDLESCGIDYKLDPPYSVKIEYRYKAPEKLKKKMLADELRCWPKDTKPDVDNLGKMILDELVKAEILKDDSKIYYYQASKWYTDGEEYVVILVESDAEYWE